MIAELTLIPIGLFIATISSMVGLGGGVINYKVGILLDVFDVPGSTRGS